MFWIIFLWAGLFLSPPESFALNQRGIPGDRLVVSINNVPHTQRQVEVYITVKESLRQNVKGETLLVSARNWTAALGVYDEDMVVMQESVRLGSFQPTEQLVDKYVRMVRERVSKDPGLGHEFERLEINDTSLREALDAVLRVAAFRRSKDRQAEVGGQGPTSRGKERWLTELEDRAVIRFYKDATEYVRIHPTGRETGGAPVGK